MLLGIQEIQMSNVSMPTNYLLQKWMKIRKNSLIDFGQSVFFFQQIMILRFLRDLFQKKFLIQTEINHFAKGLEKVKKKTSFGSLAGEKSKKSWSTQSSWNQNGTATDVPMHNNLSACTMARNRNRSKNSHYSFTIPRAWERVSERASEQMSTAERASEASKASSA